MAVKIPTTKGLSDEQFEAAERALGCSLPMSLRVFARDHDGARPEHNIFDLPGNQSGVRRFIPLNEATALRSRIEGFPHQGVPIAEDDCGNYVWLHPETGEILFWDHEVEDDRFVIADDLEAFLAALEPFEPATVTLAPGQVKHAWIDPDFKPEFD